ncbi:uncharacterized protein LOC105457711, partial [Nephila pilipes]
GDIPLTADSLKCGTSSAIKTLNSILGFTEFKRSSRKKIRNFSTFPKAFRVEKHKEKILIELSLPDLISVADLLHLDVKTNEQNLYDSIFKSLKNLDEFQVTLNNSESSISETEDRAYNIENQLMFPKRTADHTPLNRNFSLQGTSQGHENPPFSDPTSVEDYCFSPAHQNTSLCT